jgi:hypothetical protein
VTKPILNEFMALTHDGDRWVAERFVMGEDQKYVVTEISMTRPQVAWLTIAIFGVDPDKPSRKRRGSNGKT